MSDPIKNDQAAVAGTGGIIEDPLDYIDFSARYHGDPAFRKAADADPAAVLRSHGVAVPDDVKVRLLLSDEGVLHLVLPPRASGGESGDDVGGRGQGGRRPSPDPDPGTSGA